VLYYLDTVIVIYAVEGNPADQQRALNHLAALEQASHRFAISEATASPARCRIQWRQRCTQR
jgi:hypothetical protein